MKSKLRTQTSESPPEPALTLFSHRLPWTLLAQPQPPSCSSQVDTLELGGPFDPSAWNTRAPDLLDAGSFRASSNGPCSEKLSLAPKIALSLPITSLFIQHLELSSCPHVYSTKVEAPQTRPLSQSLGVPRMQHTVAIFN